VLGGRGRRIAEGRLPAFESFLQRGYMTIDANHPLDDFFLKRASLGASRRILAIDPKRLLDGGVALFAARVAQI